jgi:hypothetical protein
VELTRGAFHVVCARRRPRAFEEPQVRSRASKAQPASFWTVRTKKQKKFSVRFEERQARAACRLIDKKTHLAAFFVALAVGIGPADSSGRKKLESFFFDFPLR